METGTKYLVALKFGFQTFVELFNQFFMPQFYFPLIMEDWLWRKLLVTRKMDKEDFNDRKAPTQYPVSHYWLVNSSRKGISRWFMRWKMGRDFCWYFVHFLVTILYILALILIISHLLLNFRLTCSCFNRSLKWRIW
jgi:hypothetical protein